jgi:quinoprotein glucose dehydrogenase
VGWPVTGGEAGGSRYSPLADIHRGNVATLKVAWIYRPGDYRSGGLLEPKFVRGTAFESTPLVVDSYLIFTTPYNRVIALDPATGAEQWSFDPKLDKGRPFANRMINGGVAYWRDPYAPGGCASRVFLGTLDA